MNNINIQKLREQQKELEAKLAVHAGARTYWLQLGNVCRQLGEKEKAIQAFKKALEIKPDDLFTRSVLAELEGKSPQEAKLTPRPMPLPSVEVRRTLPSTKFIVASAATLGAFVFFMLYRVVWRSDNPEVVPIAQMQLDMLNPKFSPDGKWVAFYATSEEHFTPTGPSAMYLVAREGGIPISLLVEGDGLLLEQTDPVWLPDSTGFIVQVDASGEGSQFYLLKKGAAPAPITLDTPPARDSIPAISPDGSQIAYVGKILLEGEDNYSQDLYALVVADLAGGSGRQIMLLLNTPQVSWSPDGQWLALCGAYRDANSGVSLFKVIAVKPDGSQIVAVDDFEQECECAFFGSAEKKLVYTKNKNVLQVPATTFTGPQPITIANYSSNVVGQLDVSADGRVLAFVGVVPMEASPGSMIPTDVFIYEEGAEKAVLAIRTHSGKLAPSLSPDGTWLTFERREVDPPNLFSKIYIGPTVLQ